MEELNYNPLGHIILCFSPKWGTWVWSEAGDHLSPMLFLLAMESLHLLFCKAQSLGAISFLHQTYTNFRISLYADNAAVFINPISHDIHATTYILQLFAEASGLSTNMDKTKFYPIQYHDIDVQEILGSNQTISNFPCTYLSLPLHFKWLPKTALYPLIQRIGNQLSGWKRNLVAYLGREVLVKMVLSAMLTHLLTIYKLPKWDEHEIDCYRPSFLWHGEEPDKVKGAIVW
jgi:hypothetical protein